jgi:hypothetical protein
MINVYIQSSKQSLNKERNEKPQFLQSKKLIEKKKISDYLTRNGIYNTTITN